jgi:hypothetical protein
MTLKSINAAIVKAGHSKVELERGKGYLYFIYDDRGENYETESVPVPYLNIYSDQEWIEMGIQYGMQQDAAAREKAERMNEGTR